MKTSELVGPALDWAVATCEHDELAALNIQHPEQAKHYPKITPSSNWAQGGPIVERERIQLEHNAPMAAASIAWIATRHTVTGRENMSFGPTPLVAAMRCYVASKLSDEIEVPEVLT